MNLLDRALDAEDLLTVSTRHRVEVHTATTTPGFSNSRRAQLAGGFLARVAAEVRLDGDLDAFAVLGAATASTTASKPKKAPPPR